MNEETLEWVKRIWKIANNDSLNEWTSLLHIKFLWELVEVEEIRLWMQQNVRELYVILMNKWDFINNDDPNTDYEHVWWSRNNYFRRQCWDVLLFELVGANGIFSVALEVLQAYLGDPEAEWQKKCRAFIGLAQSIKDCRVKQVKPENLEQVVPMVLSPFPNAHRQVRCAAIEAIHQLLAHLLHFRWLNEEYASSGVIKKLRWSSGEHLQVGCHIVLPALAEVMYDSPYQDMRATAATLFRYLIKYCTRDNLREHLDGSLSSCLIVLKAWVQLWRNEERDLSPFLEILMSPVFDAAAQLVPDVTCITRRYSRVNIIREKAEACHMLCFCVDELGGLLLSEIDRVVDALIPFLKWYHDPPVLPSLECYYAKAIRIAAVEAMPKILNSARKVVERWDDPEDYDQVMQYVEELSDMVRHALNEVLDVEPDDNVHYDIVYALEECIQ